MNNFHFQHHMNWHDKHPGFTCRRCYYELDDKESYKAHLKLHENKGKLDCVLCDKVFNDSRGLRRHAAQAHVSVRVESTVYRQTILQGTKYFCSIFVGISRRAFMRTMWKKIQNRKYSEDTSKHSYQ